MNGGGTEPEVSIARAVSGAVAIALVAIVVGGVQCERMQQETIRACVQVGKPPLECARASRADR